MIFITNTDYHACHHLDLRQYYNIIGSDAIPCGICAEKHKSGQLREYWMGDTRTSWYVCDSCGFSGPGVEYLAILGGKTLPQMLDHLVKNDVIPPIRPIVLEKLVNNTEYWKLWKSGYAQSPRFVRSYFPVFSHMSDLDEYPVAKGFKECNSRTVEKWFRPNCNSEQDHFILPGGPKEWGEVTVIPLYTMPLKVGSLLFVNSKFDSKHQIHIKRLGPFNQGYSGIEMEYFFEPGYLGPRLICRPDTPFIVLSSDWVTSLRIQAGSFRQSQSYAPILGWFPFRPDNNTRYKYHWSYLQNITKVFWGHREDFVNLSEACRLRSAVSSAFYDDYRTTLVLPEKPYALIIKEIARKAVPWHKALTGYLERNETNFSQTLMLLNLPEAILLDYLKYAPTDIQEKIEAERNANEIVARRVDNKLIHIEKDGWYEASRRQKTLFSNAKCSIENVIHIGKNPEISFCQGKIQAGNQTYLFSEEFHSFTQNCIQIIKSVCLENRCPEFIDIAIENSKAMYKIIRRLHKPQIHYLPDGFGYDIKEAALQLPNLTVSDAGVQDTQFSMRCCPFHTLEFRHNEQFDAEDKVALKNFQKETPYVVSIFTAIIPSLFAPAYRNGNVQTAVLGDSELLATLFDMLALPRFSKSSNAERKQYEALHKCPYIYKTTKSRSHKDLWDNVGFNTPVFVSGQNVRSVLARMTYGHANLLLLPSIHFFRWYKGQLPAVFLKIFLYLLKEICKYVADMKVVPDWNIDIINESRRILEDDLSIPVAKDTLLPGYYNAGIYFCDFINVLRSARRLSVLREEETYKISILELGHCYRNSIGVFDFSQIQTMLKEENIFNRVDVENDALFITKDSLDTTNGRVEALYGRFLK